MALNPPITQTGVPLRVDQEFFILYRNEMEGEFKIENMGKFSAKGKVYVTTCRLVFVSDKFQKESFKSFDIPLAYLSAEKFQQPIFGSNYLEGNVDPLYNLLPGKTHFKLWFKAGGCDKFLRILVNVLTQIRKQRGSGQRVPDARMMENFAISQSQAFIDPNDPSVIYVQQPHLNQQSYGNMAWGVPQNPTQVSPIGGPGYGMPQQQYPPPPMNQQYQQPPPPPQGYQQYQQSPQQNYQNNQQIGIPVNYNYGQQQQPQTTYNQPQVQQPYQQNNQPPNPYVQQNPPPIYNQPNPYAQQNPTYNQPSNPYTQHPQQQQQQPPQTYETQPQQQVYQNQVPQIQQNYQYQQEQNNNQQAPIQNNDQAPQNQPQQDQIRNQPNTAYYFGFWGPQLQSNQNGIL
ncbi:unnamed protein product (macronuclear) [Paramecium tetraurelia]|uniref:GRAM domain-containing protein n=1 Tax=Paramecium tetraurelia TaxID=5888 RepID=A0CF75_PARTE|nr:uncharacterized protein GSPATT00037881001 [Paramecium tetraurelia]CAK69442.1 unnamed protein product [Paramecium tetraurelia]|eukprot:XP_001436839.1 hypothetical protein (macronuclear) [Paramecium tetraurelia strain d4-2]